MYPLKKFSRAYWLILIDNKRTDTRIYNLCDAIASENGQFVIVIKHIDVSFSCVCLVIDNEFRRNIVKVVLRSTRQGYRLVEPQLL